MPALQARRLRHALVLHVHVAQSEAVGGGTRYRVHENREVRQSSLAAVAHVHRQWSALASPRQRTHHRWQAGAQARDIISSMLEHSADGKAELGLVKRRLVNTSRSAAATKKELGRNTRNGILVRHGPG